VAEHAPGPGFVINFLPRFGHLLVGEEPSCSMSDGAEEISEILVSPSRNISFYVVIELQVLDCLLSFRQLMVPAGLTDRIAHVNESHDAGVVAQEMGVHVHDERTGDQPKPGRWRRELLSSGSSGTMGCA
jgi:hypothetical protein